MLQLRVIPPSQTHTHTHTDSLIHTHTCAGVVTYGTGCIAITDNTKRNKETHHFPSNIISPSASHVSSRGKPLLDLSPKESLMYNSLFNNLDDLSFPKKEIFY